MQAGHMAYDRAITVFSPDGRLFQVEYAREAVKRGTTTVGVKFKDGIVLIVDKRLSSKLIEPESIEKIFKIDGHIGCATSGLVADARALVDRARVECQVNSFNYSEDLAVESLVKKLCRCSCSAFLLLMYLIFLLMNVFRPTFCSLIRGIPFS